MRERTSCCPRSCSTAWWATEAVVYGLLCFGMCVYCVLTVAFLSPGHSRAGCRLRAHYVAAAALLKRYMSGAAPYIAALCVQHHTFVYISFGRLCHMRVWGVRGKG